MTILLAPKLTYNIQNHLIETGSHETGSMIIWDTGQYEILPYYPASQQVETDTSASEDTKSSDEAQANARVPSESQKLREAFQNVFFAQRHWYIR